MAKSPKRDIAECDAILATCQKAVEDFAYAGDQVDMSFLTDLVHRRRAQAAQAIGRGKKKR